MKNFKVVIEIFLQHLTWDTNKQSCQHKQGGQVDRHNGLEEESLEKVRRIDNDQNQNGRQVGCQNLIHNSPLQNNPQF